MTGHDNTSAKSLRRMGQDDGTSPINYPIYGQPSRNPDPSAVMGTPEEGRAFLKLVNRTGRNALARMLPTEWKAFCGMMERQRVGLAVVDRRLATFKQFLLHMGPCPTPDHRTVDRINTFDREYAPGKVRWATPTEQANNRRTNIMLPFEGEWVPLAVVARKTGHKQNTMRTQLRRGWLMEDVIRGERAAPSTQPQAIPEGISDGSGPWPKGLRLSKWTAPYVAWLEATKAMGQASGSTEAVFVAWIAYNIAKSHMRVLNARHRTNLTMLHGPHAFNSGLPDALRKDPDYTAFVGNLRGALAAENKIGDDRAQVDRLQWLRTYHKDVAAPAAAPGKFRPRPAPTARY